MKQNFLYQYPETGQILNLVEELFSVDSPEEKEEVPPPLSPPPSPEGRKGREEKNLSSPPLKEAQSLGDYLEGVNWENRELPQRESLETLEPSLVENRTFGQWLEAIPWESEGVEVVASKAASRADSPVDKKKENPDKAENFFGDFEF